MTHDDPTPSIEDRQRRQIGRAMTQAGLSLPRVWLQYFSITGTVDEYEIDAYLNQMINLPATECDKLAHAINELIDEIPPPRRAPYRGDFHA
ncbi:hypothetical protein [Arthrobacter agilis]|uniref:hypothetical protein n=1 Tax=Arthrobacter agilis TaxID=37921 RepID=UPI002787B900|nr:hypothetical protein [Arthrobacter agilis]MDQ0734093.1 hypothetical protein [Arthrobacter agilis]